MYIVRSTDSWDGSRTLLPTLSAFGKLFLLSVPPFLIYNMGRIMILASFCDDGIYEKHLEQYPARNKSHVRVSTVS